MGWKFWKRDERSAADRQRDTQVGGGIGAAPPDMGVPAGAPGRPHSSAPPTSASATPTPGSVPGVALVVEDVFAIKGRGTVVTGTAHVDGLRVGARVVIRRPGSPGAPAGTDRPATVGGVEGFRRTLDEAPVGEQVGVLLLADGRALRRDEVERGDQLLL